MTDVRCEPPSSQSERDVAACYDAIGVVIEARAKLRALVESGALARLDESDRHRLLSHVRQLTAWLSNGTSW